MSAIYKTQEVQTLIGHRCDICGREMLDPSVVGTADLNDICDHAKLEANWGYFSNKDRQVHTCDMCEECYDKVREYIEVSLGGKISIKQSW